MDDALLGWSGDYLDAVTYLFLHSFFLKTDFSQKFWAVMNSRIADNLSHVIYVLILIGYVFSDNRRFISKKEGLSSGFCNPSSCIECTYFKGSSE